MNAHFVAGYDTSSPINHIISSHLDKYIVCNTNISLMLQNTKLTITLLPLLTVGYIYNIKCGV